MGSFAQLTYVIYLSAQNFLKKFYAIKCTKIEQMETMKENNLTIWAFENGKIAYQSRTSYSEWDLSAVKSKIGDYQFDEVVNIRVGELRKKLTAVGIEPDGHDTYLATVATPKESEWVVLRQKNNSS